MSEQPLSPMLVQYLVGLCCLRWDPDTVEITIGDMVLDAAANKKRDVDVTITVAEPDGTTYAFKAFEVKREAAPLDVAVVEALCQKLLDMPSISHRAIVSSSGFTSGAQAKAASHGVELFALQPWTRPLEEQFPLLTMRGTAEQCFPLTQILLCWSTFELALVARETKGAFTVNSNDHLFDSGGNAHPKYTNFAEYQGELLLRSTEVLFAIEPAVSVARTFPVPFSAQEGEIPASPSWPHTHTLDTSSDEVYVDTGSGTSRLDSVTINGHLRWERSPSIGRYFVIERVPDGGAFAAALVATEPREGHMKCLVFSPGTREIDVRFVRLAEKHLKAIRNLKLDLGAPRKAN